MEDISVFGLVDYPSEVVKLIQFGNHEALARVLAGIRHGEQFPYSALEYNSWLQCAARWREPACLRLLCREMPDRKVLELRSTKWYNTPLFAAVIGAHLECVQILIEAGAIVQTSRGDKSNLLHAAAFVDDISIMRYLCEHTRAVLDLHDTNHWNMTALRVARRHGSPYGDVAHYLEHMAPTFCEAARIYYQAESAPLGDGQHLDSGGDLAELPNEVLAMVASHLWPTHSLFALAWTCRLLRDNALSNYVAHERYGDGKGCMLYHYVAAHSRDDSRFIVL